MYKDETDSDQSSPLTKAILDNKGSNVTEDEIKEFTSNLELAHVYLENGKYPEYISCTNIIRNMIMEKSVLLTQVDLYKEVPFYLESLTKCIETRPVSLLILSSLICRYEEVVEILKNTNIFEIFSDIFADNNNTNVTSSLFEFIYYIFKRDSSAIEEFIKIDGLGYIIHVLHSLSFIDEDTSEMIDNIGYTIIILVDNVPVTEIEDFLMECTHSFICFHKYQVAFYVLYYTIINLGEEGFQKYKDFLIEDVFGSIDWIMNKIGIVIENEENPENSQDISPDDIIELKRAIQNGLILTEACISNYKFKDYSNVFILDNYIQIILNFDKTFSKLGMRILRAFIQYNPGILEDILERSTLINELLTFDEKPYILQEGIISLIFTIFDYMDASQYEKISSSIWEKIFDYIDDCDSIDTNSRLIRIISDLVSNGYSIVNFLPYEEIISQMEIKEDAEPCRDSFLAMYKTDYDYYFGDP
ncbi:hypothetical protein TVAG_449790 [Trichomonas vaginalis G3]|uniref:Uncharacterized protein n=1 Tax=Trichomonas vaginalis (strain ATCC PRA-98 / G3) TaxID=412133 RepID=A2F4C3_TRIV3|nr:armadillo (ARM) repeat-containing protein family [Trichomonas vaginalis G3]EAY00243.1 hypothetical protein TVAG_449790 [Trichomonas vaginalis G3]KAI5536798.1 armadillo (ARM) repeat-containing protein family [Trichomonas vaginalis G3]|eukprot:XP_001313172.1 hypothetical protein [Trichomonas vaginalis G3]